MMEDKDFDFDEMMDSVEDVIDDSDNDIILLNTEEWLNTSEFRPDVFDKNGIVGISDKSGEMSLIYDIPQEENMLMICAASIKDLGYPVVSIEKKYESTPDIESLFLYGHNLDFNDAYKSRLDSALSDLFCSECKTKFKNLYLYGAFESIHSMRETISSLYSKLVDYEAGGSVVINLETKVMDDENNERTIANMLSTGYIQSVLTNLIPVKFMYKKFSKYMTGRLFTDKVEASIGQQIKLNI